MNTEEPRSFSIPPPPEGRAELPPKQVEQIQAQAEAAVDIIVAQSATHLKIQNALARATKVSGILDSAIKIKVPLKKEPLELGLDPVLGMIPVVGDFAGGIAGAYILGEALRAGLPKWEAVKMLLNIGVDIAIGLIPGVGDVADFLYKSHKGNVEIFRKYAEKQGVRLPQKK